MISFFKTLGLLLILNRPLEKCGVDSSFSPFGRNTNFSADGESSLSHSPVLSLKDKINDEFDQYVLNVDEGTFKQTFHHSGNNGTKTPFLIQQVLSSRQLGTRFKSPKFAYFSQPYRMAVFERNSYRMQSKFNALKHTENSQSYYGVKVGPKESKLLKLGGLLIRINIEGELLVFNSLDSLKTSRFAEVLIADGENFEVVPQLALTQEIDGISTVDTKKPEEKVKMAYDDEILQNFMTRHVIRDGTKVAIFPTVIKQAVLENGEFIKKLAKHSLEALYGYLQALLDELDFEENALSKKDKKALENYSVVMAAEIKIGAKRERNLRETAKGKKEK